MNEPRSRSRSRRRRSRRSPVMGRSDRCWAQRPPHDRRRRCGRGGRWSQLTRPTTDRDRSGASRGSGRSGHARSGGRSRSSSPRWRGGSSPRRAAAVALGCVSSSVIVGGIDGQAPHAVEGHPGPAVLGDQVTDEGHVERQPGQEGQEQRRAGRPRTCRRPPTDPSSATSSRTRATVRVDMLRLTENRASVRNVSRRAARRRTSLRRAELVQHRPLSPRQLDRLDRSEGLTDEAR